MQAVADAQRQAAAFAAKWQARYPAAVACVTDDLASLTCTCGSQPSTGARIRHTNLIERTFGETRRRTKVIGRLPGERSCLALVWAVLDRASRGWRGLTMTPKGASAAPGPPPPAPPVISSTLVMVCEDHRGNRVVFLEEEAQALRGVLFAG